MLSVEGGMEDALLLLQISNAIMGTNCTITLLCLVVHGDGAFNIHYPHKTEFGRKEARTGWPTLAVGLPLVNWWSPHSTDEGIINTDGQMT